MQQVVEQTKRELVAELKTQRWAQRLPLDSIWNVPVYMAPVNLFDWRIEAFYAPVRVSAVREAEKGRSVIIMNDRLSTYPIGVVKEILHHELLHAVDKWLGDQTVEGEKLDVMRSNQVLYATRILGRKRLHPDSLVRRAMLIDYLRQRYALIPVMPLQKASLQDAWDQAGYYSSGPETWARVYALHRWLVLHKLATNLDSPLTRRQLYVAMTYADPREHFFPLLFYWNLAILPPG